MKLFDQVSTFLCEEGILRIYSKVSAQLKKITAMPVNRGMLKYLLYTIKFILSSTKQMFEAESWFLVIGNSCSTNFIQMMIQGWLLIFCFVAVRFAE